MSDEPYKGLLLDTVLPIDGSVGLETLIKQCYESEGHNPSNYVLRTLSQRAFLFFDETVPLYVLVSAPFRTDYPSESFLDDAIVLVEFYVDTAPKGSPEDAGNPSLARKPICRRILREPQRPNVFYLPSKQRKETGDSITIFALWKLDIALGSPQLEIENPIVRISATAILNKPQDVEDDAEEDAYLPSGIPAPLYSWRAHRDGFSSAGEPSHVASSHVTPARIRQTCQPVTICSSKTLKAVQPFASEIRLLRLDNNPRSETLIASVTVHISHDAGCGINIESVSVNSLSCRTEPFSQHLSSHMPILGTPGDELVFIYKLFPTTSMDSIQSELPTALQLRVCVKATALLSPYSRAFIESRWEAATVLTSAAPPGELAIRPPELLVSNPSILESIASPGTISRRPNVRSTYGDAQPRESLVRGQAGHDLGVLLMFSGPEKVTVWEAFKWEVSILNRSSLERRLTIVPITKKEEVNSHSAKARARDLAELLNLSIDVHTSSLAPGSWYNTELELLPLLPGVLRLDCVRVTDEVSGISVDIRDLPDIVAIKRNPG